MLPVSYAMVFSCGVCCARGSGLSVGEQESEAGQTMWLQDGHPSAKATSRKNSAFQLVEGC